MPAYVGSYPSAPGTGLPNNNKQPAWQHFTQPVQPAGYDPAQGFPPPPGPPQGMPPSRQYGNDEMIPAWARPDGVASGYGQRHGQPQGGGAIDPFGRQSGQSGFGGPPNKIPQGGSGNTPPPQNLMGLPGGGAPNSGQAGGGGGNTLENLFKLLGLGNEGVGGSSQTTVGDVSQSTGDTLSPLLAALTSIFGTQSGQDVAFGSQAIQKLLGQEQNANNRFQTQTQQQIADNANTEAARFQTAQYGEAERRAQSNLDRFNQLIPGRRGNPLLQAPRTSDNIANSLMQGGTMPPMMA